jgi:hypothetical protein
MICTAVTPNNLASARRTAAAPAADDLATLLAAQEASGVLVSAWFLPTAAPAQHLTLAGATVTGWAAAYGTAKIDFAELTNPPAWDAALFSNKGGVVFDGTNDCLTGTVAPAAWPDSLTDCWMIVAARNDTAGATAGSKALIDCGDGLDNRQLRRTSVSSTNRASARAGLGIVPASTGTFSGAHTVAGHFDSASPNLTASVYLDGVQDGTATAAEPTFTQTRVRLGANSAASPALFFQGAIVAAAVLGPTAVLQDMLDLEALMRARLS